MRKLNVWKMNAKVDANDDEKEEKLRAININLQWKIFSIFIKWKREELYRRHINFSPEY